MLDSRQLAALRAHSADNAERLQQALNKVAAAGEISAVELVDALKQAAGYVRESLALNNPGETGLPGLQDATILTHRHVLQLRRQADAALRVACAELENWPRLVNAYLSGAPDAGAHLLAHLQSPCWIEPLSPEQADMLEKRLNSDLAEIPPAAAGLVAEERPIPLELPAAELLPDLPELTSETSVFPELPAETPEPLFDELEALPLPGEAEQAFLPEEAVEADSDLGAFPLSSEPPLELDEWAAPQPDAELAAGVDEADISWDDLARELEEETLPAAETGPSPVRTDDIASEDELLADAEAALMWDETAYPQAELETPEAGASHALADFPELFSAPAAEPSEESAELKFEDEFPEFTEAEPSLPPEQTDIPALAELPDELAVFDEPIEASELEELGFGEETSISPGMIEELSADELTEGQEIAVESDLAVSDEPLETSEELAGELEELGFDQEAGILPEIEEKLLADEIIEEPGIAVESDLAVSDELLETSEELAGELEELGFDQEAGILPEIEEKLPADELTEEQEIAVESELAVSDELLETSEELAGELEELGFDEENGILPEIEEKLPADELIEEPETIFDESIEAEKETLGELEELSFTEALLSEFDEETELPPESAVPDELAETGEQTLNELETFDFNETALAELDEESPIAPVAETQTQAGEPCEQSEAELDLEISGFEALPESEHTGEEMPPAEFAETEALFDLELQEAAQALGEWEETAELPGENEPAESLENQALAEEHPGASEEPAELPELAAEEALLAELAAFDGFAAPPEALEETPATEDEEGLTDIGQQLDALWGQTPEENAPAALADSEEEEDTPTARPLAEMPASLAGLAAELAEIAEDLSSILDKLLGAGDESAALFESIEQYTETLLPFQEAVEAAHLNGLREVCVFVMDNVLALGSLDQAGRQTVRDHFETWPGLLLNFLLSPSEGENDLVDLLQAFDWPAPLSPVQAQSVAMHLAQLKALHGQDGDRPLLEETEETAPEAEAIPVIALEQTAEAQVAPPEVLEQLSRTLSDTVDTLNQGLGSLLAAEDGSEALLVAAGEYSEGVQGFASEVENAAAAHPGLGGLLEVCTFINDNLLNLSLQPQTARQAARETLETWPALALDYLLLPEEGAGPLAELLQSPAWPEPLPAEAASSLAQRLSGVSAGDMPALLPVPAFEEVAEDTEPLPTLAEEAAVIEESSGQPLSAELQESLSNVLAGNTDALSAALDKLAGAEDDSEAVLEAAGEYTEALQDFWSQSDEAGLAGLSEVCAFVNDNLLALSALPQAERQAAREAVEAWPALALDYLLLPEEGAGELAAHLQQAQWPAPLDAAQAQALINKLAQLSSAPLPAGMEQYAEIEEISGPGAPAETRPELAEWVSLGDPDVLEQLRATLSDSAESLSTALEKIVSMDNQNEAFLEAVETYTNHVQAIYETAEQAGLGGLQEVCAFVNDNLLALSGEEQAVRQAAHDNLAAWPGLVLDYLLVPAEGATALVEHLRNPQWAVPLDDERADSLLASLRQGASAPGEAETPAESLAWEEEAPVAGAEAEEETASAEMAQLEMGEGGGQAISLGNAEMVEMLREELNSSKDDMAAALEKFVNTANSAPNFAEITENYSELVGRLAAATEMMGLSGLQTVCGLVLENIAALAEKDQAARAKAKDALAKWPELMLAYLEAPMEHVIALLNHFREPAWWPVPLADENAHSLLNALTQSVAGPAAEEDAAAQPSRATQASPEDVVLNVPEDVNQDLLDAFLQEAPQHAADFNAALRRIVQNPVPEDVKLAQRLAHTLKGSSNIIGIKGIAKLAHQVEDILEYLYEKQVPPPKPLTNTLIEAGDTLEIMVDFLLGKDEPPANALNVLQDVLDWANRIDRGQLQISEEEIKQQQARREAPAPAASTGAAGGKAPGAAGPVTGGEGEQFLRVPTKSVDNLMRLVGEMSIAVGQIQERLKHVIQSTKSLTQQDILMQQKSYELETLVDVRDVSGRSRHRQIGQKAPAEEESHFDSLEFEQYNELHSCTHSFIESIADSRELTASILGDLTALDGMFVLQNRINKEFQQIVMSTRLVPARTIVARLERIVRQTCRATDKLADFEMLGGDVLMDGEVLTKLTDPLMHILRNSVDHGMEMPADRKLAGKSETGRVAVNVYPQGNNIVVRVEDDGKGLNYDKIRATAIERGLLKEGQEATRAELARMIFIAGFSTKGGVTQISGRGVGMDVVHTAVLQLKGTVDIESEPGQGTAIILTLPTSLVTVHVLLVKVGGYRYALPTSHLDQALTPDSGEFRKVGENISFHMDKNAYPVTTLADLLNLPGEPVTERDARPLVLVREEGNVTAVVVDGLLASRDLVSKTMGRYVKHIKGVSGASILGDGSVVALLDLPELLREPAQVLAPLSSGEAGAAAGAAGATPHILIVDDSLSVRKSLSQLVEDSGYEALLAKDGLEAIEVVGQHKPAVMLVDMEMPRMNGIELTAHIRANESTKNIPIFMITSRTTEKHRQLAQDAGVSAYLTKPYQDTELLKLINDAVKRR